MSEEAADEVIAVHRGGLERSTVGLNTAIQGAWDSVLEDPTVRADIAQRLGIPTSALASTSPPLEARVLSSGLAGMEVAILVVKGVVSGGSAAMGKAAAEYIWKRYVAPLLQDPTKKTIGSEVSQASGNSGDAAKGGG